MQPSARYPVFAMVFHAYTSVFGGGETEACEPVKCLLANLSKYNMKMCCCCGRCCGVCITWSEYHDGVYWHFGMILATPNMCFFRAPITLDCRHHHPEWACKYMCFVFVTLDACPRAHALARAVCVCVCALFISVISFKFWVVVSVFIQSSFLWRNTDIMSRFTCIQHETDKTGVQQAVAIVKKQQKQQQHQRHQQHQNCS